MIVAELALVVVYDMAKEIPLKESPFNDMACKKVIIRNDDVYQIDNALQWLSDLIVTKDVKATYAVIPTRLSDHPGIVDYLNNLDEKHFELATHGLAHTKEQILKGMRLEQQYKLIKQGNELMQQYFGNKPYTFVPPFQSDDLNTARICKGLGYHTLTSSHSYSKSGIATDFAIIDFSWESGWGPVRHRSYIEFEKAFDNFYSHDKSRSPNEFFVIALHHLTFCDDSEQLNDKLTNDFERSIDYMKSKNVEFMTIEEAYRWHVDEPRIRVGKVNRNTYFIELISCQYGHKVKFCSPPKWRDEVLVRDMSTGNETQVTSSLVQFDGLKGHYYHIVRSSS